jgi:Protein of unknown function (DUF1614)
MAPQRPQLQTHQRAPCAPFDQMLHLGNTNAMPTAVVDWARVDAVRGFGAPVASIGGAGTFDGIFLTGIVAALLAGFSLQKATP